MSSPAGSTPSTTYGVDNTGGVTTAQTPAGSSNPLTSTWHQPTESQPVPSPAEGHAKRPKLSQASQRTSDGAVNGLWDFGLNPDVDWTALFGITGAAGEQEAPPLNGVSHVDGQSNDLFHANFDDLLQDYSQQTSSFE